MNGRNVSLLISCAALLSALLVLSADATDVFDSEILVHNLGSQGEPYENLEPGDQGGTYSLFTGADPSGFNPVVTQEAAISNLCNLFLSSLLDRYGATGELFGDLASSWEVSEDGTRLTFRLRKDIVWSDGKPFTSRDVIFTYSDLHLNDDVDSALRGNMKLPNGEYPTFAAIDDHTVVVNTSVAFRPIMEIFLAPILPAHKLAHNVHKLNPQVPPGTFNTMWSSDSDLQELVGLGPFLPHTYVPGQYLILERNPRYYHFDQAGTQLPYLNRVVFHILGSPDAALLRFLNHELDAVSVSGADIPFLLAQAPSRGFAIHTGAAGENIRYLAVNQDIDDPLLRDLFGRLAFRKALAYACDRASMANLIWLDDALPANSPISVLSPFFFGRDGFGGDTKAVEHAQYSFDLETAAALLDGCGIKDSNGDGWRELADGRPLALVVSSPAQMPTSSDIAAILVEDFRVLGIRLVSDPVDWGTYVNRILSGENWQAMIAQFGAFQDPHWSQGVFSPDGALHFWRYSAASSDSATSVEKRIDWLYEMGAQTMDPEAAFEFYDELQMLLLEEDLGLIPLVSPGRGFAVSNRFGNAALFSDLFEYNSPELLKLIYELSSLS